MKSEFVAKLSIRQEQVVDHQSVFRVIEDSFREEEFSDHDEHHLVGRLRQSDAFVPELSLVAELDGKIVGHILLSKIKISNGATSFVALALAPVTVIPEYQKQGIGGRLIQAAHQIAANLGFKSIVVVGHANYYPRFGYTICQQQNIQIPFEVPDENCMVKSLQPDGLIEASGLVEYPKAFFT